MTIKDLLKEASFTDNSPGYRFSDFFNVDPELNVLSRREGLEILRDTYKGADVDGVEVYLPEE